MGVLKVWDATSSSWVEVGGGGASALDDLTDVNAPTPSDGQALVWDATPGEWVAATPAAGASLTVEASGGTPVTGVDRLVFPSGTTTDLGSGDVSVREVPTGVIGAKVYLTGTQTVSAATDTMCTFNTTEFDTDGFFNGASPGLLTVPAGMSGLYLVVAGVVLATTPGNCYMQVYKNTNVITIEQHNEGATNLAMHSTTPVYLAAGDYVKVHAYRTSGTAFYAPGYLALYKLGSGNVAGLDTARARRTSGSLTTNVTSWTDLDNGLDLVVPAQAGDVLLVEMSGLAGSGGNDTSLDAWTVVSGSPVNPISGASGASRAGVQAWYLLNGTYRNPSGGVQYVVQAGDLDGGSVRLRLRYRAWASPGMGLAATADNPFHWSVVNLRGGAASRDIGYEFAYAEFTGTVSSTATTEAGATTVVTAPAVTFDGSTKVKVEFECVGVRPIHTVASAECRLVLFDGSTAIGQMARFLVTGTGNLYGGAANCVRYLVPSVGSHTYSIRLYSVVGTEAYALAGSGGVGGYMPGYIRITKA